MEIRKCKISITNPGGNASKGAEKHRISIPTTWTKKMGFTKDDRTAILTFENDKIIISKSHNNT